MLEYNNSDQITFPPFESKLRAKLWTDGHAIGNKQEQVWYAFGCLKSKAITWIYPWIKIYQDNPIILTLEGLFKQIEAAFGDSEIKWRAQQKLGTIRQGNKDFWDFINEFDQTLLEAGSYDQNNKTKKA
jgi:hypothetical protein